jgi:hypothetical protein
MQYGSQPPPILPPLCLCALRDRRLPRFWRGLSRFGRDGETLRLRLKSTKAPGVAMPPAFYVPTFKRANLFRIHSYEKCARNSFRIHSYKIIGLKVPSNHTLTKKGGGEGGKVLTSEHSLSSSPKAARGCSVQHASIAAFRRSRIAPVNLAFPSLKLRPAGLGSWVSRLRL